MTGYNEEYQHYLETHFGPESETENELDNLKFQLRKYQRWHQEKNDHGWHEDYTFAEIEEMILKIQDQINQIEDQI